jgi:hypothetical protein
MHIIYILYMIAHWKKTYFNSLWNVIFAFTLDNVMHTQLKTPFCIFPDHKHLYQQKYFRINFVFILIYTSAVSWIKFLSVYPMQVILFTRVS